jgi:ribosome-associated translation inhibitor RaiA
MLPQVTFRGLSPSSSIVDVVFKKARKLGVIAPQLEGCHVVIEVSGRGHQRHTEYRVAVHLSGGTHASRRSARHASHENVYVALRDAFESTRRQLENRGVRPRAELAPIEAH